MNEIEQWQALQQQVDAVKEKMKNETAQLAVEILKELKTLETSFNFLLEAIKTNENRNDYYTPRRLQDKWEALVADLKIQAKVRK